MQEVALGFQRQLCRFAGRDVDQRVVGAYKRSFVVVHGGAAEQDAKLAAIPAPHADFHRLQFFVALQTGQPVSNHLLVFGQDVVAEMLLADHLFAGVAQPVQFGLVDQHIGALGVHRVVTAGRLVVERLGLIQRDADALVGVGQFLGAHLHPRFQLDVQRVNLVLLLPAFGDVARDSQQHHRLPLDVADGGHHGVPPLGRAFEGVRRCQEARAFAAHGRLDGRDSQRDAVLGPPLGPVAQAHLLEIVHLDQFAALGRHLQHATLQIQHFGAIGAAGNDLSVEVFLQPRVGFQCAQEGDVLHKPQLASDVAAGIVLRHIAHQYVANGLVWAHQSAFDIERLAL